MKHINKTKKKINSLLNIKPLDLNKISSSEFIHTETWKCKPLNKWKENSLAQLVLGLFLSALQSSLCNLQVLKVLPASVTAHLSILRIQFAISMSYTPFVIQVMHTNTYLWASPWYFQNKCPCLNPALHKGSFAEATPVCFHWVTRVCP